MRTCLALVFLSLAAAGCAVGPNYSRPATPAQAGWKESTATNNLAKLPSTWWQIFQDAQLSALERQAIDANQDLRRAVARLSEARAMARVSAAELYPSLSAGAAYSRERLSDHRGDLPFHNVETDDFSTSFDFNYELDVWGRVRRSVEASRADAAAAASDVEVVVLTLTADVARHYYQIRALDGERVVMESTVALRRDAVRLQQTRNQAGLINEADVARAKTELANVEAELHSILRARAQTEHAPAVLCGQPPTSLSIAPLGHGPARNPNGPSCLTPGATSRYRRSRTNAGSRFRAHRRGQSSLLPHHQLTGAAGLASADLGTLVDWPSRMWSAGPSIHLPVFEGGRNRANLKAADARYEQSVASYRATILNAFREVEDALSDVGALAAQTEAVQRALLSARDTAALATERYQRGLSNYLDVVDAERIVLQAERQATQLLGQRAISTILLAKALGGGWERTN
ncbi:MAG: efflux transporter outer membrane subunit [Verrucomicrobiota bacterium]